MKTITIVLFSLAGILLSGCVAYDIPNRDDGQYRNERHDDRRDRPDEHREHEHERSGDRDDHR